MLSTGDLAKQGRDIRCGKRERDTGSFALDFLGERMIGSPPPAVLTGVALGARARVAEPTQAATDPAVERVRALEHLGLKYSEGFQSTTPTDTTAASLQTSSHESGSWWV